MYVHLYSVYGQIWILRMRETCKVCLPHPQLHHISTVKNVSQDQKVTLAFKESYAPSHQLKPSDPIKSKMHSASKWL